MTQQTQSSEYSTRRFLMSMVLEIIEDYVRLDSHGTNRNPKYYPDGETEGSTWRWCNKFLHEEVYLSIGDTLLNFDTITRMLNINSSMALAAIKKERKKRNG